MAKLWRVLRQNSGRHGVMSPGMSPKAEGCRLSRQVWLAGGGARPRLGCGLFWVESAFCWLVGLARHSATVASMVGRYRESEGRRSMASSFIMARTCRGCSRFREGLGTAPDRSSRRASACEIVVSCRRPGSISCGSSPQIVAAFSAYASSRHGMSSVGAASPALRHS